MPKTLTAYLKVVKFKTIAEHLHAFFPLLLAGSLLGFCLSGCIPEEEKVSTDSSIQLRFSTDTVLFDTVFSSVGSITKRFRVYNTSTSAVRISKIELGGLQDSPYSVIVNGIEGKSFEDQLLLGKDSMLVLVSVTIDPRNQNLPFFVKDSLSFLTNSNWQDVKLVSWGQDAHFFNDSILDCHTIWTSEKPYVIYSSILVDSLCTLTIQKGARIYLNTNSYIFVRGSLQIEGEADDRVLIRNARLDAPYENAPGQWNGIVLLEGSTDNQVSHAIIRNAVFGFNLNTFDNDDEPDLVLESVVIENMLSAGIIAVNADIKASNTLINNCADYAVGNLGGGNYEYIHCTFANYGFDFFRESPSVVFTDYVKLNDGSEVINPLNIRFQNNIVWGNLKDEILVVSDRTNTQLTESHNLIRTTQTSFWEDNNNILNLDPKFKNPLLFDYSLDTLSPAKDKGLFGLKILDLEGKIRDNQPDLGALERIE